MVSTPPSCTHCRVRGAGETSSTTHDRRGGGAIFDDFGRGLDGGITFVDGGRGFEGGMTFVC